MTEQSKRGTGDASKGTPTPWGGQLTPSAQMTLASEENPRGPEKNPAGPAAGRVEAAVRADVEALMTAHPMGEALAEMSYALARALDTAPGYALAAVSRELRAVLLELARMGATSEDLSDDLSTPTYPGDEP